MTTESQTLDIDALECALPTLTNKLEELKKGLSTSEQDVLSSIINSAALHLESMEAIESTAHVRYMKPISAAATVSVRRAIIDMPNQLNMNK